MRNMRILATALFVANSTTIFAGEPIHRADFNSNQSDAPAEIIQPAEIQPVQKVKSAVEMRAAKKADKLMQKYRDACAAGNPEKARKYARQALDLDPECFTKPQPISTPL